MKKRNLIFLLVAIFLLGFTACKDKEEPAVDAGGDIGIWSMVIEGVEGVTEFTSADAATLTAKTVNMTITNSAGESKDESFTGVSLPDVLAFLKVTEFTSLSVEASDGYAGEYNEALALDADTIVAWAKDGKNFDSDQPIRVCPKNGTGNQFIKNAAKIIVVK